MRKVAIKRGAPASAHFCRSVTGYTRPAGAWPRPRSSRDRAAAKVRKTGTAESAPPRRREEKQWGSSQSSVPSTRQMPPERRVVRDKSAASYVDAGASASAYRQLVGKPLPLTKRADGVCNVGAGARRQECTHVYASTTSNHRFNTRGESASLELSLVRVPVRPGPNTPRDARMTSTNTSGRDFYLYRAANRLPWKVHTVRCHGRACGREDVRSQRNMLANSILPNRLYNTT